MSRKTWVYLSAIVFQLFILVGCSSQQVTMTDPERDPWEAYNRKIHSFNMAFDNAIFRPVAKGYDVVMPDPPQRGVRNFFRNLAYPVTAINLVLQGKFEESLTATGRFLMNSTVGVLGFFDVATKLEMPYYEEDFGQTLAVWGWKDSRYLVMPIFGPYTARDFIGRGFYGYFHPISFAVREYNNYIPLVVDLISLRAELQPFQEELDAASDPYVLVRDVWLQNREFRIYDGEPPEPDYDALLEEY
jgi:phospholipid-binding lipoprotein MlaA